MDKFEMDRGRYLETDFLISIGFVEIDSLMMEYEGLYGWVFRIHYEGYAFVLYKVYARELVPLQDFQYEKEFETFWDILIRKSESDH